MLMKRKLHLAAAMAVLLAAGLVFATSGSARSPKAVTFNKEVAPIFFQKCAECHHAGEAAPFSALSYKEVRPWAKSIREKVVSREMPPWHADPHYGEFANDRRLSEKEIATIVAWIDGGAQEGSAKDLPRAPVFTDGWAIGKPDAVFEAEEYTLEASGPDEYQYFDVQTSFAEDRYIQLAEARPGNRRIVHHIIAFIVPPGTPNMSKLPKELRDKAMEAALKNSPFYRDGFLMRIKPEQPIVDDGCSATNPRGGGGNENILTGYAPGHNADIWEAGVGKRLPAGAVIRFQIHYSKVAGKVEKDRSSVGVVFAKSPPETLVQTRSVGNILFQIPPGAENHKVTGCLTLRSDTKIFALMPHMHLRGKAMEYKVFYPDGKSEILLSVPNYSFSWQINYLLEEPKVLPKGTRIQVTGVFDNSTKNKYNPDPTKPVRYGEPTYDEMMLGFMDYAIVHPPIAKLDPQILDRYVGRYDAGLGMAVTVRREGNRLIGEVANQKFELLPASETSFFIRGSENAVTFTKTETGEVSEAVIQMGNRTIRGKKVKEVATGGN